MKDEGSHCCVNGESALCLCPHSNVMYHDWLHGFCFMIFLLFCLAVYFLGNFLSEFFTEFCEDSGEKVEWYFY